MPGSPLDLSIAGQFAAVIAIRYGLVFFTDSELRSSVTLLTVTLRVVKRITCEVCDPPTRVQYIDTPTISCVTTMEKIPVLLSQRLSL